MSIPEHLLKTAEDRRHHPRSAIALPVGIGLGRDTPVRFSGNTIDLSERGALLDVTEPCVTGGFLTLWFDNPTIGEMTCGAIVRSTALSRGVGVEFVGLAELDRQHLGDLTTRLSKRPQGHTPGQA